MRRAWAITLGKDLGTNQFAARPSVMRGWQAAAYPTHPLIAFRYQGPPSCMCSDKMVEFGEDSMLIHFGLAKECLMDKVYPDANTALGLFGMA